MYKAKDMNYTKAFTTIKPHYKGFAVALLLLLCSLPGFGQTITEGQPTLIYSLPKTEFIIQASVEKVTETPGEFYQYSERYLAESDVITSKRVYYRLKNLSISTQTVPDNERTFQVIPSRKSLVSLLSVNDQGILCGINVPPVNEEKKVEIIDRKVVREQDNKLLPLNEEYMLAGSVAKMAEGVAKQIYRIRENRIDLLAGDVEYMPKDGESMKTMIEQMNRQEKELSQLFTGTTIVEEVEQNLVFTPSEAVKDKVLFRFSSFEGIVPADDLSGSPYYITIAYEPVEVKPTEKKKKPKEEVFTIVPVSANVQIDNGEKVFFNQDLVIPQLGVLMPIPLETMSKNGKAYVSPETGRLLSIEQGAK